jgi:hypothetical protein
MDLSLQVKILRVLQEKEFREGGGSKTFKVDVRIVAATNRTSNGKSRPARFREDLFYRLNVIPLHLPPLRERGEDILLLAEHFLAVLPAKATQKAGHPGRLQGSFFAVSLAGNVRELKLHGAPVHPVRTRRDQAGGPAAQDPRRHGLPGGRRAARAGGGLPAGFVWPRIAHLREKRVWAQGFSGSMEERLLLEALEEAGGVKKPGRRDPGIKRTT